MRNSLQHKCLLLTAIIANLKQSILSNAVFQGR